MNLRQFDSSETEWDTLLTLLEQGNIEDQEYPEDIEDDHAFIKEKASSYSTCPVGETLRAVCNCGMDDFEKSTPEIEAISELGDKFQKAIENKDTAAAREIYTKIVLYIQDHQNKIQAARSIPAAA